MILVHAYTLLLELGGNGCSIPFWLLTALMYIFASKFNDRHWVCNKMSTSEWEKEKNRIYSKQVLHLTSTPPLSKIRSAGILSIWQKETTSSHIWTAIKFEYFDLTKIRFFEIPWFFPDFQQNFKFPDFSLQGIFFTIFPVFPVFQSAWPPCNYWSNHWMRIAQNDWLLCLSIK